MSRRGILLVAGVFALAFLLLAAGKCGYSRIESIQTLENAIAQARSDFPTVKPVSTKTVLLYEQSGATLLIVDMRTEEEFGVSHLPGARHLEEVSDVKSTFETLEETPDTVLVYGSLGFRSGEFAKKLQNSGVAGVEHLEGGIFQWANEGHPIVDSSGESATQVHPYNKMWGRLLNEDLRFPLEE